MIGSETAFTELEKARFWTKVEVTNYCWLWKGAMAKNGYGLLTIRNRNYSAHRVAYLICHGEIPSGLEILHSCDVRHCVNPDHLSVGTRGENVRDMHRKGRDNKTPPFQGEEAPNAKLTEAGVREIRRLYAGGTYTQRQLAKQFDVSQKTIMWIINRITWKHIL